MSARGGGSRFWDRLNPRERTLVMALVLVFFLMGTAVLFFLRASHLGGMEQEIGETRRALDLVYTRGATFKEQLRKKQERESKISSDSLQFATLIETATGKVEELAVTNQEEQPSVELGGGLKRRSIEFDLRSVTLDALTKFLATLESEPGHVIFTQRLLLRSPSASEDRLNADVELVTWERAAGAAEGAATEVSP